MSVLGITRKNAELLQSALRKAAVEEEAVQAHRDEFGQRYVVDFEMKVALGRGIVRSTWIVLTGEDLPRLTSCYVLRSLRRDGPQVA